jgi:ATP-binding cassette, subfamily B, bacterial
LHKLNFLFIFSETLNINIIINIFDKNKQMYYVSKQSSTKNSMIETISFKKLISKYKKLLTFMFLLVCIITGLSLAIPNLTGEVIKMIESNTENWGLISLLFLVVVLLLITEVVQTLVSAYFREKVGYDLREKLLAKITSLNYADVNKVGIGESITLFGSDINNVKNILAGELVLSIKAILLFVTALILLFITNWKLGLIAFISLPIIIAAFAIIFKSVTKYFSLSQTIQTDLNNAISQNIYGSNLIRVQNSQSWENTKFNFLTGESRDISYQIINAFSSLIPIINTISNWTTFGILYFGALTYIAGQIKLGDINTYITYYALLTSPIFIIGFNSQGIARLGVSLKRINNLLALDNKKPTGKYKKEISDKIELKNIHLSYDNKPVLKNINISIPIGKKTAILGPTGAGKSLLINLITGMITPDKGNVLVDGREISDWDSVFLKDQVTCVYQESLIFAGNLKDNIILNRVENEERLEKAISTATLESVYKTKGNISELGGNLSGGQKQRLTLARAIYNNPKVLLLDDFTARVDNKTENKIKTRLEQNYPDTTIISISQTIESIKDYDKIILMMEGEVLSSGTHQELIKISPEYNQIISSQKTID